MKPLVQRLGEDSFEADNAFEEQLAPIDASPLQDNLHWMMEDILPWISAACRFTL
jgi:hypothetical protein